MTGDLMMSMGGVPPYELQNCLNWAFGEGYQFVENIGKLRELWNEKHKNLFKIREPDDPDMAFMCIGKAYMEQNFDGGKKTMFSTGLRKRKIFSIPGIAAGKGKGGD